MAFDTDKIFGFLNLAKEKGKQYANIAADKTKEAGRMAKLKMDQAKERENLKKAYVELGKLYFEEKRSEAEGLFAQLCDEIEATAKRVDDIQAEYDELKSELGLVNQNAEAADFEAVVSEAEEPDIEVEIHEEE